MNNIGYLKDGNFYYQPLFIVVYLYNMKNIITSIILIFLAFTIYAQTPSETKEKKENLVLIIKNSGGEYIEEIVSELPIFSPFHKRFLGSVFPVLQGPWLVNGRLMTSTI